MDKEQIKKNYLIKVKEYKDHNKSYYDESNPKIPDSQYDKLKNEILNLEKTYKFLNNKNSPSKSVGYKASKSFDKYKHKVPMLSLSNAFNEEDLYNFEKEFLII